MENNLKKPSVIRTFNFLWAAGLMILLVWIETAKADEPAGSAMHAAMLAFTQYF